MTFRSETGPVTPFDILGLDDAVEWLEAGSWKQEASGRPVVVPGVKLEGLTAEEKHRAMARWLFSPDLDGLLYAHIERLWHALSAQSQRRLGVLAASTGVSVSPSDHAELMGALGLIAEAEGTLDQEAEFAETYLTVPWVCAAIAEIEAERAKPGKTSKRRAQVREAVARHREKQRTAETEKERKKREASESRMDAVRGQQAIALDGEGVTLDDGSHIYRYLCASLSDGTVLGQLEEESGIGTAQALDFVVSLPKHDSDGQPYLGVFGYGLGYDICKWLERLANKPLFELYHSDDLKPKVRCGRLKLLLIGKCLELTDSRAPTGLKRTKVWDILKGFQSTFVKALMAWEVGTPEEHQRLEDMKKQRGNFKNVPWEAVKGYCQDECRLLAALTEKYIRAHVDAGIDLRGKYHGAGSTSDAFLMKMQALDKKCTRELKSDAFDGYLQMRRAFSRSFFGGRAEVSSIGIVRGPYYSADIASAYPHVLYTLPCVRHGKWSRVSGRGLDKALRACKLGCVHFELPLAPGLEEAQSDSEPDPARGSGGKRRKKKPDEDDDRTALMTTVAMRAEMTSIEGHESSLAWGPLPYRTDKASIVFPASHPGGWAWLPEYETAKRHFPHLRAKEAWVLKGRCKCRPPYEDIGKYYLLRIEWGSDGRGKVLKLGYNGCYGKTAQTVGKNPKYACRVVAGHITGSTRARLFDAIWSAQDPWSVVYAATDGLMSTEKLDPPNPPKNETAKKTSKWLGVWELSEAVPEDIFIVQPGFWFSMAPKGKARTRGAPLDMIYEHRSVIVEQWLRHPTRPPRGLPMASTFHGITTSIRPPTKKTSKYTRDPLYGRWTRDKRVIAYVVNPKRSGLVDQGDGRYRLLGWVLKEGMNPESADYKKDPIYAEKDQVNDEQPDYVESLSTAVGEEG